MDSQPRCYYLSPMLLAVHGVVVVLLLTGNELRAVIDALALEPELVRNQPWRLITWHRFGRGCSKSARRCRPFTPSNVLHKTIRNRP